ncbi:MAG: hypothetical protein DRN04_16230 [Thermoprotei archaeon]|nr:MAG: hypothetical protein DRN04_16230 [Thermoprotei archaeon]
MEVFAILAEAVNCMRRARDLTPPGNRVEISALRWELYASLQNILDALAIVVSDLGLRKPSSYADLGVVLSEEGLVSREDAESVRLIAVTRNTLAHAYRKLTVEDFVQIVKHVLPRAEHIVEVLKEIANRKGLDPKERKVLGVDLDKIGEVFRRHNVVLAYLFGSRAKGLESVGSDYDIAVLFSKPRVTVVDEIELTLDIAKTLNIPPDKVDVIALNNADVLLKARILREGIPIYMLNNELRMRWERGTFIQILNSTDLYAIYIKRTLKTKTNTSPP